MSGGGPGTNTGHGHVWPRPDGVRARCGGPGVCGTCALDYVRYGVRDNTDQDEADNPGPPPDAWLDRFVRESNMIEGIGRDPTPREMLAHQLLLSLSEVTVEQLSALVSSVQPGARLRDVDDGTWVEIDGHRALSSGPAVREQLEGILASLAFWRASDARQRHRTLQVVGLVCEYEHLHPFTDGNGRSGRALWAWYSTGHDDDRRDMERYGFLRSWWYQTLTAYDERMVRA